MQFQNPTIHSFNIYYFLSKYVSQARTSKNARYIGEYYPELGYRRTREISAKISTSWGIEERMIYR